MRSANLGFVPDSNRQCSARDPERTKAGGNFFYVFGGVRNERETTNEDHSRAGGAPEGF